MTRADLMKLLKQSRNKNERLGVTGLLLYDHGTFMQILEGSKETVLGMMQQIEVDSRHQGVKTLEMRKLAKRYYPNWSMAFLDPSAPELSRVPGYSRYLEKPVTTEEILNSKSKAQDLLLYFKLVMKATTTSLRYLLDSGPLN